MQRVGLIVCLIAAFVAAVAVWNYLERADRNDGRLVRDMVQVQESRDWEAPSKTAPQSTTAHADGFRRQDGSYEMSGNSSDGGAELPVKWSSAKEVIRMQGLGARVYAYHCASCHGMRGAGDGKSAAAEGMPAVAAFQNEKYATFSLGRFYKSIADGQGNMPAYGDKLTVEELWAAALWVFHLRTLSPLNLENNG